MPSAPPAEPGRLGPPEQGHASAATNIIGIVDDDDDVRSALEALLESHGYATSAFATAEALLASPQAERLAGVITDLQMPGMGGIELARALRQRAIPAILITAFATPLIERRARDAGVQRCLRKPFASDHLALALRTMLDPPR